MTVDKSFYDTEQYQWIRKRVQDSSLKSQALKITEMLCQIDTTTNEDINTLRESEDKVYDTISAFVQSLELKSHEECLLPIDPDISSDPYYTFPRYAGAYYNNFDAVYGKRNNLLLRHKNSSTNHRWLLHAHIDTVPPFLPILLEDDLLHGRGAVDVKCGVTVSLLLLKMLQEYQEINQSLADPETLPVVDVAFTIDEETGGNGSLSLANALNDKQSKSIVVLEPTENTSYPANRGALWFDISICQNTVVKSKKQVETLTMLSAQLIKSIFLMGKQLRQEGVHSLFLPGHVQTCIGIWGNFGFFPASSCSQTDFLFFPNKATSCSEVTVKHELVKLLKRESVIHEFASNYGVSDVIQIDNLGQTCFQVVIKADSAHMGSMSRDTDAAIQTAILITAILDNDLGKVSMDLPKQLHIEGGQGFTPSHKMADISDRIAMVCQETYTKFFELRGPDDTGLSMEVQFNKIHNEAFCSDLNAPGVRAIHNTICSLKGYQPDQYPNTGWHASCDARIFARDNSDVVTFGPGSLDLAHSPNECIRADDIMEAVQILFLTLLTSKRKKDCDK